MTFEKLILKGHLVSKANKKIARFCISGALKTQNIVNILAIW